MLNLYRKPFTDAELREIAAEAINIVKGKSQCEGNNPFHRGKDKLNNCYIRKVSCADKDTGMFNIVKDYTKRGQYILQGRHYLNGQIIFEIAFSSKVEPLELYMMLAERHNAHTKQFNEYTLYLTDGTSILIRNDESLEKNKDYFIGKWYKNNKWYLLLAKGDDHLFPRCDTVALIEQRG